MICLPCKMAGETNALSREAKSTEILSLLINRAIHMHSRCRGSTWCDCAHVTSRV